MFVCRRILKDREPDRDILARAHWQSWDRSFKISHFPGCSLYCLNSTMGQQSSVMTQLSIPIMEKEREDSGVRTDLLTFGLVIVRDSALEFIGHVLQLHKIRVDSDNKR